MGSFLSRPRVSRRDRIADRNGRRQRNAFKWLYRAASAPGDFGAALPPPSVSKVGRFGPNETGRTIQAISAVEDTDKLPADRKKDRTPGPFAALIERMVIQATAL
jgi:hypothetical protein